VIKSSALSPEELRNTLHWRYAVKKFDPTRKIPDPVWKALEESLVLSPSSLGLQPWKFFVVDAPALRAKLKPVSWNQSQITDAARLVVFAAKLEVGPAEIERLLNRIVELRKIPLESLAGYKAMMQGAVLKRSPESLQNWIARQAYIALGVFLTSAAALGVDACPMEGLDTAQYDHILGLPAKGYTALFAATAGYRAADDAYAELPKVRYDSSEVLAHL